MLHTIDRHTLSFYIKSWNAAITERQWPSFVIFWPLLSRFFPFPPSVLLLTAYPVIELDVCPPGQESRYKKVCESVFDLPSRLERCITESHGL